MELVDFQKRLSSVHAINVTPFDPRTKAIMWEPLERQIEYLLERGVEIIVPCGNTGEFYALTLEEAKAVTKRIVEIVAGRALVIAGVGYSSDIAIGLGNAAKAAGVDAILIHHPVHPYVTNGGILRYYQRTIDAVDLPSFVYFKDPNISDEVLKTLSSNPRLVGVKYAINDLPRFARLVREVPEEYGVTWICGTAEQWAPFFYFAGARGFTSGLVNACPEKSLNLLQALKEQDTEWLWRIWLEILPFEQLRAKYNAGNNVVVIKEAMNLLGLQAGVPREPAEEISLEDRSILADILSGWRLI